MVYRGLKARRATLEAELERIDSARLDTSRTAAFETSPQYRAEKQLELDEVNRLIRLRSGEGGRPS
jgi:hypothetical protein